MTKNYNILEWVDFFEKSGETVDPKKDFLETSSRILYPGRFYVLEYMAKTRDMFNARPVILGMGLSKADPDSFLCLDLSVMPIKVRMRFIEMYFNMYRREIEANIDKYYLVEDADKQTWMKTFSYDNLMKMAHMMPIKNAIKKYKIENTLKIYALPFSKVYKVLGKYCDENYYVNGTIRDAQNEFIAKMRK